MTVLIKYIRLFYQVMNLDLGKAKVREICESLTAKTSLLPLQEVPRLTMEVPRLIARLAMAVEKSKTSLLP